MLERIAGPKAVFALCLILAVALSFPAPGSEPSEAPDPAVEKRNSRSDLVSKLWWNQGPKIELLALSEAQREGMDALLEAYLERRAEDAETRRKALDALGAALLEGNESAARQQAEVLAEATSRPTIEQVDLMIEVTSVLTSEQRSLLAREHPKLFSRFWLRTGRPLSKGSRSSRRPGGSRPQS